MLNKNQIRPAINRLQKAIQNCAERIRKAENIDSQSLEAEKKEAFVTDIKNAKEELTNAEREASDILSKIKTALRDTVNSIRALQNSSQIQDRSVAGNLRSVERRLRNEQVQLKAWADEIEGLLRSANETHRDGQKKLEDVNGRKRSYTPIFYDWEKMNRNYYDGFSLTGIQPRSLNDSIRIALNNSYGGSAVSLEARLRASYPSIDDQLSRYQSYRNNLISQPSNLQGLNNYSPPPTSAYNHSEYVPPATLTGLNVQNNYGHNMGAFNSKNEIVDSFGGINGMVDTTSQEGPTFMDSKGAKQGNVLADGSITNSYGVKVGTIQGYPPPSINSVNNSISSGLSSSINAIGGNHLGPGTYGGSYGGMSTGYNSYGGSHGSYTIGTGQYGGSHGGF